MSQELEDRFQNFAKRTRDFCRKLKWDIINIEYIRQLSYENENLEKERYELIEEGIQIRKILSAILNKLSI
jgi:hypothetical protein